MHISGTEPLSVTHILFMKYVSFLLHSCCGLWEGWTHISGNSHWLGGCGSSIWPSLVDLQLLKIDFLWRVVFVAFHFNYSPVM